MLKISRHTIRWLVIGLGLAGATILLSLLGFWVELLWYSAMDSTSRFCSLGLSRALFAIAGSIGLTLLSWPLINQMGEPGKKPIHRWFYFSIAPLGGLVIGLGMWELASMQAQDCASAEVFEILG